MKFNALEKKKFRDIMRNIIIVGCISTGINFVEDIFNRGYNPIALDLKVEDTQDGREFAEFVINDYKRIPCEIDMIYEGETFEETLEEVRKYDPLLIVAGHERGVPLATKLSAELGLLGNPVENLEYMTVKDKMQERIAEYGLRSIKGKAVRSLGEAIQFYDKESLKEVVLKPNQSDISTPARVCTSREEMMETVDFLFHNINHYGHRIDEILIQELITGDEYVVNTVSHEGIPRVTMVWKYNKIKTADGSIAYDSCETVNDLNLGEAEMIEYAYAVADALGIQYGPVHGEYIIDENGPVLIEANCCPMSGNMPAEFLDRISGQHETNSILDSYLKPDRFNEALKRQYELFAYGVLKFFIVPNDMIARSAPMVEMTNKLKAYYSTSLTNISISGIFYSKTKDSNTSAGTVFLVHEDRNEVENNLNFLRNVEKNAFSLILSDDVIDVAEKDDEDYLNDVRPLVEMTEKYGTGIFVTDQFIDDIDIFQVGPDKISDVNGNFEFIIINLNKSLVEKKANENVKIFLDVFSKIRTGGYIFVPKNTYQLMAGGRKGVEALIKVSDYKIKLPPYNIKDVIVASNVK